MKFVRFIVQGIEKIGIFNERENKIIEIKNVENNQKDDMIKLIEEMTDEFLVDLTKKSQSDEGYNISDVKICSPIKKPIHDIICIGVNYKKHLKETKEKFDKNFQTPLKPVYFSKRAVEITGTEDYIESRSDIDKSLDYEVELAVIIGKKGKDIPKEKVEEYIFGYSIFNDFSSRELQKQHVQWFKGKSLDTYSAMGPVILHKSKLNFPVEVDISSKVNDEIRQNSNTKYFLNDIPTLISDISQGITLEPGDIIITGTPDGVGLGFTPPKYLKKGDTVVCEISEIGKLINIVK